MWKNFLTAILVGLLPGAFNNVLAQQILVQAPNPAIYAPTGDASIYFYWNADSATSGQAPQKGVGTITIGANVTAGAGSGGMVNNYVDNHGVGNSGGKITISTGVGAGTNLDCNRGEIGFYMMMPSTNIGRPIWGSNTNPTFKMQYLGFNNGFFINYMDVSTGPLTGNTLVPGNTFYVQIAWDQTQANGWAIRGRTDNGAWISTGGAHGVAFSSPTIQFEGFDGNAVPARYDQVLISSDPLKDLYSIRNNTSF